MILYIGSDHVIQNPGFDFQQQSLSITSNPQEAICSACRRDAAGVLNTYQLDLNAVTVKVPGQQVLSGFDSYDVILPEDPSGNRIALCSRHALDALQFMGASFVQQ